MKLYVIRHGQTEWNVLKKMQGSVDIPLNEKGIEQAYITKEKLKDINIDLIFSSPLKRARKTAEIISDDMNVEVIIADELSERCYGEFEGINKLSFDYNEFWSYNKNKNYDKAENVQLFFDRVYKFIDELKDNYSDKNILIVTHAGVVKAIECYANGMLPDEEIGPFLPGNCSVSEYIIGERSDNNG